MQAYSAVSNGYVENQMKSIYRTFIEILKKKKESKTNKIFKTEKKKKDTKTRIVKILNINIIL